MKNIIYLMILVSYVSTPAFAGGDNATISCQSKSGRTLVKAFFPVDLGEAALSVTVDGKTNSFVNDEMLQAYISNPENNLGSDYPNYQVTSFTSGADKTSLSITAFNQTDGKSDEVLLSLRSTGKLVRSRLTPGGEKITFQGLVSGYDPRDGTRSTILNQIRVSCVYVYSL